MQGVQIGVRRRARPTEISSCFNPFWLVTRSSALLLRHRIIAGLALDSTSMRMHRSSGETALHDPELSAPGVARFVS